MMLNDAIPDPPLNIVQRDSTAFMATSPSGSSCCFAETIIALLTFTTAMKVRHLGQFMFMTNNVDQEGVGVILFEKLSLDFLENLTFFCCYP